jgi:hypothetical protein
MNNPIQDSKTNNNPTQEKNTPSHTLSLSPEPAQSAPEPVKVNQEPAQPPQTPSLPDSSEPSQEQLQQVIADRSKSLDKLIAAILPYSQSRVRERLKKALEMTSEGKLWREIQRKTKLRWIEISCFNRKPEWLALWRAAREAGEDYRAEVRASEAHKRAVDGWKEPVFWKGEPVGSIRKFDNRLLEFLMKADDPAKYREQGPSVNVQQNSVQTIVIMHRRRPKPEESAPNPRPIQQESDKPQ